ncbi:ribonuclease HII [Clostridium cibarium]|uniref:Ribonuclease HII n=1 Tax=Clostridium cibarium TaxID=2762247 RepID=A0ABR8PQS0_9CLOT|nr:ribonuclease HII [Clostridium cibarium]MBD7910434.1 ribonuclease HII [Clostridium cibarium]
MKPFNMEISSLSYKEVKTYIDEIDIYEEMKEDNFFRLIENLKSDSRKNVSSLGIRLEKSKEKIEKEILRVRSMYEFDRSFGDYKYIAGVDEVGRGPLAGPIVACAVILDEDVLDEELILGINDSKKLSEKKREELASIIREKALAYEIAISSHTEIDNKGIAYSNNKVFLDACNNLNIKPDLVLSDGYLVKSINIENKYVIKGDTKSACIAAASIVAKVYRDNLMKKYAEKYPYYNFEDNAGYGTIKHVEGLKKFGPCEIHRKSFLTKIL